jgi:hypothetical protein
LQLSACEGNVVTRGHQPAKGEMMPTAARIEADEALSVMLQLGVARPTATLYLHMLERGGVPEHELHRIVDMSPASIRGALTYLGVFQLISQDIVHDETIYFASNPRNAWKAHDTAFYWVRSMHVGDIDALPPLPEMEDETRRRRYAHLERLCGTIYDRAARAHDPLRHRHRDIGSDALFASWLAHAIASAQTSILAVERPPRLPDLAPIWVALTRRIRAGVSYTRIVGLDEVLEHGLDIVDRDMDEYGIDLRLVDREHLVDAFYIIDGKRLLLKNIRGQARDGRPPHFGVYTSQNQIVRRHIARYDSDYLARSVSAGNVVERLRVEAMARHDALVANGRHDEADVFMSVARFGKFAPPRPIPDAACDWLLGSRHLARNEAGHVVMVSTS